MQHLWVSQFTFGLFFDNELLDLLFQRVGGGAGVGPWEQRGGDHNCFILCHLLCGMRGLPAIYRGGVSCGHAV